MTKRGVGPRRLHVTRMLRARTAQVTPRLTLANDPPGLATQEPYRVALLDSNLLDRLLAQQEPETKETEREQKESSRFQRSDRCNFYLTAEKPARETPGISEVVEIRQERCQWIFE